MEARRQANAPDPEGVWLYRWRDADGTLQITDTPPKGRSFERIDRDPRQAIEVDGRL